MTDRPGSPARGCGELVWIAEFCFNSRLAAPCAATSGQLHRPGRLCSG